MAQQTNVDVRKNSQIEYFEYWICMSSLELTYRLKKNEQSQLQTVMYCTHMQK